MALRKTSVSRKRLRRKKVVRKLTIRIVLFFVVLVGIIALFYIPQIRIKEVFIKDTVTLDPQEVRLAAQDALSGKYFWIFPKNNIFIFPKEEIADKITQKFGRVKNILISRDLPAAIVVSISERKAEALWCRGDSDVGDEVKEDGESFMVGQDCAFLDASGVIFEASPVFFGGVFAKFLDRRRDTPSLGESMISEIEFEKIMALKKYLEDEFKTETEKVVLKNNGEYELFAEDGWRLIFNENNEEGRLLEDLKIVFESQIKERIEDLDYVDFRFGNKVFYKFGQ